MEETGAQEKNKGPSIKVLKASCGLEKMMRVIGEVQFSTVKR